MRRTAFLTRLLSFALLLALVAVVTGWSVLLASPRPAVGPGLAGAGAAAPGLDPATKLFGSATAVVTTSAAPVSNIQVVGVVQNGTGGIALLNVGGRPVYAAVGDAVDRQTTVRSVSMDRVVLVQNGRALELQSPARADVGILTGARPAASRTRRSDDTTLPVGATSRPGDGSGAPGAGGPGAPGGPAGSVPGMGPGTVPGQRPPALSPAGRQIVQPQAGLPPQGTSAGAALTPGQPMPAPQADAAAGLPAGGAAQGIAQPATPPAGAAQPEGTVPDLNVLGNGAQGGATMPVPGSGLLPGSGAPGAGNAPVNH